MTPDRLELIMSVLKMRGSVLARRYDVTDAAVRKWLSGAVPIPKDLEEAMELRLAFEQEHPFPKHRFSLSLRAKLAGAGSRGEVTTDAKVLRHINTLLDRIGWSHAVMRKNTGTQFPQELPDQKAIDWLERFADYLDDYPVNGAGKYAIRHDKMADYIAANPISFA